MLKFVSLIDHIKKFVPNLTYYSTSIFLSPLQNDNCLYPARIRQNKSIGRCGYLRGSRPMTSIKPQPEHYRTNSFRFFHIDQTFWNSSERVPVPPPVIDTSGISEQDYEQVAEETLESLTSYFDELVEASSVIKDGDVMYSSGVLTVKLGKFGTYVINKQTPNRQIWFSSPTSGPKRYDFINGHWIYRHDGVSLHRLLNTELPKILPLSNIDFESHCHFGKPSSSE